MSINATEIYEAVTARFQDSLSKGVVPWQKPWVGAANAPRNLQSGKPYRGINSLLLSSFITGYDDPRWTTFAAARKMGGKVVKGERSQLVTLWKRIKVKDDNGDDKTIAILRYFRVFNVAQVVWPEGAIPAIVTQLPEGFDADEAGDEAFQSYIDSDEALRLTWGGGRACYVPAEHRINLPNRETFKTAGGFYGTAFHEAAHSTAKQLSREFGVFGDAKYGREELVAEMASAFVLATLGIEGEFDNSTAYIKGWMKAIEDDGKLIVKAAGQAQKAADRILGVYFTEPVETALDKTAAVV